MVITFLILLVAIAILGWGFYRARPYGQIGILAWLQSVTLMAPWLLFFGLFAFGFYLNLIGILGLLVISAGAYIYLGRRLRAMGRDEWIAKRAAELAAKDNPESNPSTAVGDSTTSTVTTPAGEQPESTLAIPMEELSAIEGIFGIDTFFRTETVPYQEGAIFKGNLRGEPEAVYTKLSQALAAAVEDKYRLFLVESPENKPVVVVLPRSVEPSPTTWPQKILAVGLAIATLVTSLEASSILRGFDIFQEPTRIPEVLPLALGILLILTAHEMGHRVIARKYGIKLSPPFLLPAWQIGAFGSLTRFESLLPNRTVLFDIAFAGPVAGGLLSLAMLLIGFVLSHPGSLFQVPSEIFQGSILVGTLARVTLGSALQESLVDIHPLAILGWLGLVINAINLMPAGQLDGGRIVYAIYGRKTAGRATLITLILLALVSLANPLSLYWAALILFLQRDLERPSQNELTEPDDARAALALLVLFLMLATLLPLTPSLAGRLGIGA